MIRKRIIFYLPNLNGGGAERSVVEMANIFAEEKGIEVFLVLSQITGDYLNEVNRQLVKTVSLGTKSRILSIFALRRQIIKIRPDVIFSAGDFTNLINFFACLVSGKLSNCYLGQRGIMSNSYKNRSLLTKKLIIYILMRAYNSVEMVISNSYGARLDLIDLGLKHDKIKVVSNHIDVKNVLKRSEETSHVFNTVRDVKYILSVGSLLPVKDYNTLIKSFAIVNSKKKDIELIILGDGPLRTELESLVMSLGLEDKVRFLGFVQNPFPFIASACCFVSTSISEGCPNAILQALVFNVPIIASKNQGDSQYLLDNGKFGRLVEIGDVTSFSNAILEAIELETSGRQNRKRAEYFSIEKMFNSYKFIFNV